jgi:FecR protein
MNTLFILICMLFTLSAFAQTKVAVVKLIRGEADVLTLGKTTKLKVDDWVESGAVVKTAEKSFVKLIFTDKSQMNVGPNSEMKIESFSGKDSGVIDLVKGKIRSQVTKDYLQMKDKDKSKLFIKTQNALMGVRGTDFMISTNGINTSTVLFEGEIVFNKLEDRGELSSSKMEEIVEKGVRMFPGEFSVQEPNRPMPTVPSLLNVQQREQLEKNADFNSERAPGNAQNESAKSIVPDGLRGALVSNSTEILKSEVAQVAPVETPAQVKSASADADGFIKGDQIKPANGSFVHIDSGVIIPPGPGAILDTNTNTYIPAPDAGKVASDGSYIPPKNVEITGDGKILVAVKDNTGVVIVKEVPPPPPVVHSSSITLGAVAQVVATTGALPPQTVKPEVDLNPGGGPRTPVPVSGGVQGITDPSTVLSNSQFSDTTITVKP